MNAPRTESSHVSTRTAPEGGPDISVVVPCRNERRQIEETLNSILAQSVAPGQMEVIVVDGASDDGTREILGRLALEEPRLTVIDNPDRIAARAMNLGIEQARGRHIAILGAHTTYDPDYLATCLKLLEEVPDAACVGGPIESRGRSAFGRAVAVAMSHPVGVGNARHRFPDFEGYAEGACFPVFRRQVFEDLGGYDVRLVRNQDDEFNFRLKQAGGRVFISPRARSVYYVRENTRALWRQYYQYGFWRVAVLRKHRQPASWRQMVPALFYAGLAASWLSAAAAPAAWRPWLLLPTALYLIALAGTSLTKIPRLGLRAAGWLPWVLLVMHAGYAAGFLRALFSDTGSPSAVPGSDR